MPVETLDLWKQNAATEWLLSIRKRSHKLLLHKQENVLSDQVSVDGLEVKAPPKGFDVEIPLRGCDLSLEDIKNAYAEFQELATHEGERLLNKVPKLENQTQQDFEDYIAAARKGAFLVTVTIIGGDDNIELFGDNISIFDRPDLPYPIKTVFFTNQNSFRYYANNNLPP